MTANIGIYSRLLQTIIVLYKINPRKHLLFNYFTNYSSIHLCHQPLAEPLSAITGLSDLSGAQSSGTSSIQVFYN
jgi:hypothetical protein